MSPERWRTTEEILLAAWDLPAEQREALLVERCAGDEALLTELRELVVARTASEAWRPPERTEQRGTRVQRAGPFELERMIGRGGMGAVYLAHRADGQFEQKVAVKLIGLPFETEVFRERFRKERQILAGLNHPNITRLLDGGVTADGELYLAMEYVDGVAIDQYCKQGNRPLKERLELFRKVCSAVQYAHQNLIVHRDIKPSNILVTAGGEPKLLDFGTARLMVEAESTHTGLGIMTASHASPEQLKGEAVTTLSDVFSLGVVLFELLAGANPFTDGMAGRLASQAPPAAPQALRGELEQILHKAVAFEPRQRYSSAEQFSEDIGRYLAGEPVMAHPPGLLYRASKFARRHALGVAGAGVLTLTLAGGVASTLWEARQAQLARVRAEKRFNDVRQLANYLVFDIHDGLQRLAGSTSLQKQVVERSLQYLDSLEREPASNPQLRLELAEAYQKLGDVLGNPFQSSLGDRKAALDVYPKALALASAEVKQDPHNLRARQLLASIKLQHGGTQFFGGDRKAGQEEVRLAVENLRVLVAESPEDFDTRLALSRGLTFLAARLQDGGGMTTETEAAQEEKLYWDASGHLKYLLDRHPGDAKVLRQMAQVELSRSQLWGSQNPSLTIQYCEGAVRLLDGIPEASQDLDIRRMRANILRNIGWAQGQLHSYNDALANTDKAREIFQAIANADPTDASALYQLTSVYRNRGIIRGYAQDKRGAIEDFAKAAEMHRHLSEKDPANTNYRMLRGELLARIGTLYHDLGQEKEAVANATAGLEIMKQLAISPKAPPAQLMTACSWFTETEVIAARDPMLALSFCQRAVELTDGKDAEAWNRLSAVQRLAGNRQGAIASIEKALSMVPPTEPGHPKTRQREQMEQALADLRGGK